MKIVNTGTKLVYTSLSGALRPGEVSSDGGPKRRRLEDALHEVVSVCERNNLGIRLNKSEAMLLNRLMDLDEKGGGFDRNRLPKEIREDPTGEKRMAAASLDAQRREMEKREEANIEGARNEAEINGETQERNPVGPATLTGEQVSPDNLKSGFERIMEENARIAAGEQGGVDTPGITMGEVLDPIGAHLVKPDADESDKADGDGDEAVREPEIAAGADAEPIQAARNSADDGTRSADATTPDIQTDEKGGEMDRLTVETAKELSNIGPSKGRGRGKKANK